jgi:hypothetical protein
MAGMISIAMMAERRPVAGEMAGKRRLSFFLFIHTRVQPI